MSPPLRPRLEVADILRAHGPAYRARHPVSPEQARVMTSLAQCRTAFLGGHVDSCDGCGFVRISYNSCRDRHCPKCQAAERAAWVDARLERLLPVDYFHVVFTLPEQLQPLVLKNRRAPPRATHHTNRGLIELGAYAARKLRQRRTYLLHPWNPVERTGATASAEMTPRKDGLKLARYYQSLLDSGKFANRAALARFLGVSRARVTQVLNRLESPAPKPTGATDVA